MNCIAGAKNDAYFHAVGETTKGYEECTGDFGKL